MPVDDREVFEHFLNDPDATLEIAHLAYAAYASSKYDWVRHFEGRKGQPPGPDEIDEWIASQPPSRLDEILETAKTTFDLAATAYMARQIEEEKDRAVRDSILAEVQRLNQDLATKVDQATSFAGTWKQGLFLGVAASFAFTALVIAGGFIFDRDPSPFGWFKSKAAATAPASPPATAN